MAGPKRTSRPGTTPASGDSRSGSTSRAERPSTAPPSTTFGPGCWRSRPGCRGPSWSRETGAEQPLGEEFWNVPQKLRESIATLINAEADSISLVRSTAHAISLLAGGLDWEPGDNVVGARGEYPANVYPWLALKDRGVEMRFAGNAGGRVEPESVLELVDGRTRVVALSQVEFWNG